MRNQGNFLITRATCFFCHSVRPSNLRLKQECYTRPEVVITPKSFSLVDVPNGNRGGKEEFV